ncbi:MAG TPA: CARDB domain-containing protein, partial [Methylomirabilota bacterium]|nr:CARDB domain-containing protein [Methylomirabilota bacterium]
AVGNTPTVLVNTGTIRKSAGTGTTRLGINSSWPVSFQNTGLVECLSGVLQFFGGGTLDGSFATLAGARIEFTGGTYTQTGYGSPLITGTGEVRFTGGTIRLLDRIPNLRLTGGTALLLPDFQVTGAISNLVLEGTTLGGTNRVTGTLTFQSTTGPLTVASGASATWTAGTLAAPVLIESNAVLALPGTATRYLNAPLTNHGTIQWISSAQVNADGSLGARIENHGLIDLQGNTDLYGVGNTPTVLVNTGTIRKSAGTGTARLGVNSAWPVSLQNFGAIECQFGIIEFFGPNQLTGGTLSVAIRGLSDFGRIRFQTAPTLTGTLSAYLTGGYLPAAGNKFSVVTFDSATGTFTDTVLPEGFVWQTAYEPTAVSLTVQGACAPPPDGLIAWWAGDGNANDLVGGHHGALQNGATFAPGQVGQAFNLDGVNDYVDVGGGFDLGSFTLAAWVFIDPAQNTGERRVISKDNVSGPGPRRFFALKSSSGGPPAFEVMAQAYNKISAPQALSAGWHHLAATRDLGANQMALFVNGVRVAAGPLAAGGAVDSAINTVLGRIAPNSAGEHFSGLIDEAVIFGRALSTNEIATIYASSALGLCRPTQPPVILAQPQSRTNAPGTTATFSASAGGSIPLFYRWLFNGVPLNNGGRISGATSNVLTIASVQPADAGAYSLSVSNAAGAVESQPAQLAVDATAPVISQLATNPGVNQCLVSWQTSEPATTVVEYGPTPDYGFTNRLNGLRTQHGPTLTGLIPGALYHFRVRSADAVSNETISANFTFTTLPAPDLRVASLVVTNPGPLQSGAEVTIQWVLTNAGAAAVATRFNDRVVVRNNTTAQTLRDVSLHYDPGAVGGSQIAPGQTLTRETKYRLPDGPAGAGALAITVTTDSSEQIIEWHSGGSGETNNVAQINLTSALPPYPDLQPANLVLTPTNLVSGGTLTVLWQNTNSGTGPADGFWWDRVLIVNTSRNVTLYNNTVPYNAATLGAIPPGGAVGRSLTFNLPDSTNAVGHLRVTVEVDYHASVFEYVAGRNAETNNAASALASANLAQYPDLRIASLSFAPASPASGDDLIVSWRLTNAGTAAVSGSFHDLVLVRRGNNVLDQETVLYDAINPTNGPIGPGEFRDRQRILRLPDGTNGAGAMQIELTTDSNDQVLEINALGHAESNNRATNAFTAQLAAYSDLVAGAIVNPANALPGSTVLLTWAVTNIGVGPVSNSWSEQVYWSDDAVIGNDTLLATFSYTNVIPAGQFLARTQSVVLPTLGSGNRWFIVRVDSAARVFELNESNNVSLGSAPLAVPAATTLVINSGSISEGNAASATLIRNGNLASPATFTLTSSDTNRLAVPPSVTIAAGQSAVGLQLSSMENELVDGNALVTVQASAAGYAPSSDSVTVVDDDQPLLVVQASTGTLTEGAGPAAAVGY